MAINITALLAGAKAIASSPKTHAGALGSVIVGGLYAATLAGVAIPTWAFSAGPLAGLLVYKMLPKGGQEAVDHAVDKVVEIATEVPQLDPTFPTGKNGQTAAPPVAQGPANSNINQGGAV